MKKLLSILSICLVFISCSPDRVLFDDLTRGTKESTTLYFEGELFTGVSFDVYEDGQLEWEANYKDGELDGLYRSWYENGQLDFEYNYKDGKEDGLCKGWYENGELSYETNYKDGVEIN